RTHGRSTFIAIQELATAVLSRPLEGDGGKENALHSYIRRQQPPSSPHRPYTTLFRSSRLVHGFDSRTRCQGHTISDFWEPQERSNPIVIQRGAYLLRRPNLRRRQPA